MQDLLHFWRFFAPTEARRYPVNPEPSPKNWRHGSQSRDKRQLCQPFIRVRIRGRKKGNPDAIMNMKRNLLKSILLYSPYKISQELGNMGL